MLAKIDPNFIGAISEQFELFAKRLDNQREAALATGAVFATVVGVSTIFGFPLALGAVAAVSVALSAVAYARAGKAEKFIAAARAREAFKKHIPAPVIPLISSDKEAPVPAEFRFT